MSQDTLTFDGVEIKKQYLRTALTFITPHGTYHLDEIKGMQDLLAIVEDGRRYRWLKEKRIYSDIDAIIDAHIQPTP